MPNFLVWVKGLKGPEAQLWAEKQVNGEGKAKEPLSIRELEAVEIGFSLDYLRLKYPYA